jgi:hypothetical protein
MFKKRQILTLCLVSKIKDYFGLWEVNVLINKKEYTFLIPSEYAVEKFERMSKCFPGRALNLLKKFNIKEKEVKP